MQPAAWRFAALLSTSVRPHGLADPKCELECVKLCFIVADDHQVIHEWRGAVPGYALADLLEEPLFAGTTTTLAVALARSATLRALSRVETAS
jgi:hypothetical protein